MSDAVSSTGILVKRKPLFAAAVSVASSSVAAASLITTSAPHGLQTGEAVTLVGHTGSTPALSGPYVATVVSPTTFTVPVAVSVGGTGGTLTAEYTTIGEITKVTPPGYSRNKIETSTHNEGTESNILGLLRQKDPAFTINYVGDNATHIILLSDILNNVKAMWQIAFPSGITCTAAARVQQFNLGDAPVDAAQTADCALTWAETVVTAQPA